MPSFNEIVGVIVTFVVLSTASGHGEWVFGKYSAASLELLFGGLTDTVMT